MTPPNILFGSKMQENAASTPYLECGIKDLLNPNCSKENVKRTLRCYLIVKFELSYPNFLLYVV